MQLLTVIIISLNYKSKMAFRCQCWHLCEILDKPYRNVNHAASHWVVIKQSRDIQSKGLLYSSCWQKQQQLFSWSVKTNNVTGLWCCRLSYDWFAKITPAFAQSSFVSSSVYVMTYIYIYIYIIIIIIHVL